MYVLCLPCRAPVGIDPKLDGRKLAVVSLFYVLAHSIMFTHDSQNYAKCLNAYALWIND